MSSRESCADTIGCYLSEGSSLAADRRRIRVSAGGFLGGAERLRAACNCASRLLRCGALLNQPPNQHHRHNCAHTCARLSSDGIAAAALLAAVTAASLAVEHLARPTVRGGGGGGGGGKRQRRGERREEDGGAPAADDLFRLCFRPCLLHHTCTHDTNTHCHAHTAPINAAWVYAVRASDSDGIAEGSLALPSLLAGLAAADAAGRGRLAWVARCCLPALAVLWHLRSSRLQQQQQAPAGAPPPARGPGPGAGGGSGGSGSGSGSKKGKLDDAAAHATVRATAVVAAAGAAAVAVAAATNWPALLARRLPRACSSTAALCDADAPRWAAARAVAEPAALAALAPGCFHFAMRLLPATFSAGEGALLTQGLLLLLAAGARALGDAPAFWRDVWRPRPPAGAAGVWGAGGVGGSGGVGVAATLLAAVRSLAGGLAALPWARPQAGTPGQPRPGPDDLLPSFVPLLVLCTLVCGGCAAAFAPQAAGGGSPQRQQRQRQQQRRRSSSRTLTAVRAAAALAAAPAAALVALLAAWTLRVFLPAAPGRLPLLAYWAALLAAALPLMRLAALRRVAPQVREWGALLRWGARELSPVLRPPSILGHPSLNAAAHQNKPRSNNPHHHHPIHLHHHHLI